MTDFERLKCSVQETEFPVGKIIREGNIEVEVMNTIQETEFSTIYLECDDCIFNNTCHGKINCSDDERHDENSVIFRQIN